jgi:hypothetical protein
MSADFDSNHTADSASTDPTNPDFRFEIVRGETESEIRQRQFAEKYGVTPSDQHACVDQLVGKRCRGDCPRIPAGDHLSLWNKDGNPFVIVSQPSGLSYDDLKETVKFCARYGLRAEISAWPSWHSPGEVLTVLYFRNPQVTLSEVAPVCDHTWPIELLNESLNRHDEGKNLAERALRMLFNGTETLAGQNEDE